MKKILCILSTVIGMLFLFSNTATATAIGIYVDSAPNVYGSPDYAAWLANTKTGVSSGSFVNMSNGINPANIGTTNFEIEDEVVYSFGDLGKRLTWGYYIEGETTETLAGRLQIRLENWWDGEYSDFYADYYGSSWLTPTKWENYDADGDGTADGVFGLAGMALWGANGVNTTEALIADIMEWGQSDEVWRFTLRLDNESYSIDDSVRMGHSPVPEPTTMVLFGFGLLSLGAVSRKKLI